MKYKIISPAVSKDLTEKVLRGESISFDEHEQELGKGPLLPDATLKQIATQIQAQKRRIIRARKDREALDAEAFAVVHSELPAGPDHVADPRFWHRFALVFLADVIRWRFPGKGGAGVNLANFGVGSSRVQRENYLYKLWLRGELSRMEKGTDRYRPGRNGSVDFWTSHVHRQGFADCRPLAHELILFQYPSGLRGKPRLWPGPEKITGNSASDVRGIRTLVKELRRFRATVEFALLEADELREILRELSRGLSGVDGKRISD